MRTCTICKSPDRESIDSALIGNDSVRDIAGRFSVSKSAVARHKPHIRALVKTTMAERGEGLVSEIARAENRVENLYVVAEDVLRAAMKAGNAAAALQAVRTAVSVLGEARALAELRGGHEAQNPTGPIDAELEFLLATHDAKIRAELLAEMQGGEAVQ